MTCGETGATAVGGGVLGSGNRVPLSLQQLQGVIHSSAIGIPPFQRKSVLHWMYSDVLRRNCENGPRPAESCAQHGPKDNSGGSVSRLRILP